MFNENYYKYHPILINMIEYVDIVTEFIDKPKTVLEIGSLHGNDANELMNLIGTTENNIHVIEANPEFYKKIKIKYPKFNVYNFAATNINGFVDFNAIDTTIKQNFGISSLLDRNDNRKYNKIKINAKRMDNFLVDNKIESIDICKIDVEGNIMETLLGFGDSIKTIKSFHIEAEHKLIWENQKLFSDVEKYLILNKFKPISLKFAGFQSDSIWVKNDLIKKNWWGKYKN